MSDPRQVSSTRWEGRLQDKAATEEPSFDPLRLCVFATVALLGWVLGPWALLGFAVLAIVGYARARRAGLLRSKCKLGDTRLVLAYLVVLALAAGAGIYLTLT
jgi:hypothetical protein